MLRKMLKWLSNLIGPVIFFDDECPEPAIPQTPFVRKPPIALKPIRVNGNCIEMHTETMRRLTHLRNRAAMIRDELDAMADECCILLDIDPRSHSVAADFARDIVDRGSTVGHAIDQVARHKKGARQQ